MTLDLNTAVCFLAAASVIASLFNLITAFAINQLSVRAHAQTQTLLSTSQANTVVSDKLIEVARERSENGKQA